VTGLGSGLRGQGSGKKFGPWPLAPSPRPLLLRASFLVGATLILAALCGCRQEMYDQPKYKPLGKNDFFPDTRNERPLPDGTVARGFLRADSRFYRGTNADGKSLITEFPVALTPALLSRGRERFGIYCTPCHDRTGSGAGMVVKRGYRPPPSFHIDRLRDAPVGHYFDVITNGFGAMPDYAAQIDVPDRWAIIAYIRALQLSQNAKLSDVPAEDRSRLEALPVVPPSAPAPTPAPRPFPFSESKPSGAR
jgi:mono/diheme cytochrome c family protein